MSIEMFYSERNKCKFFTMHAMLNGQVCDFLSGMFCLF